MEIKEQEWIWKNKKTEDAYSAMLSKDTLKEIVKERYNLEASVEYKIDLLTLMVGEIYHQLYIEKYKDELIENKGDE